MDKNELDSLINTLGFIALYKGMLPFRLRGWVSALGLHVQERRAGPWTRLQAGGKFRSYLDAWQQEEGNWDVKKFDKETWQQRFAQVLSPTLNIADYLRNCTIASQSLSNEQDIILQVAIQHYKLTQLWRWLPGITMASEEVSEQMAQLEMSKLREEIQYAERIRISSRDSIDWAFLALLYDLSGRHKDMENALKTAYELVRTDTQGAEWNVWRHRRTIGMLYFAAFCNSRHMQEVVVQGTIPSRVTPDSLLYTDEEVRMLAVSTLETVLGDIKLSVFKADEAELQEIQSAIAACEAPSREP